MHMLTAAALALLVLAGPARADGSPPAPVPAPGAAAPAPRIEIGTACMEVSASRAKATVTLTARAAIVRFRAPAAARYAAFTLRHASGTLVGALAPARVTGAGAEQTARIALTARQRWLVRSGAARLAIAYSACGSQSGAWQWVAPAAS